MIAQRRDIRVAAQGHVGGMALDVLRINARPGIAHRDADAICPALLGADRQLSCPCLDRAHCLDRIQDQVQDDLLQLNTIALNGRQRFIKAGLD